MTRKEVTGKRDLTFSQWIRDNLPDSSSGMIVSDLDWIICNYKSEIIMLIEVKTRGKKLADWQRILFNNIDKWLKAGVSDNWVYLGFHTITFTRTWFTDGDVYFDNRKVTEIELRSILSIK